MGMPFFRHAGGRPATVARGHRHQRAMLDFPPRSSSSLPRVSGTMGGTSWDWPRPDGTGEDDEALP